MGLAHSMLSALRRKARKSETITPDEKVLALQVCRAQGVFEATIRKGKHATSLLAEVIDHVPGGYEAIPPASKEVVDAEKVKLSDRRKTFLANRREEKEAVKQVIAGSVAKANGDTTGAVSQDAAVQRLIALAQPK